MARTKTQKILRIAGLVMLGVLMVGLVGYFFVVEPIQIRKQKQDFAKAETQIEALAKQIEDTIGKPDETKKVKNCDRPNLKSEKGPLSCDVSVYLLYKDKDSTTSTNIISKVSTLGSEKPESSSGKVGAVLFSPYDGRSLDQIFYQKFTSNTRLSCGFQYNYPVRPDLFSDFHPDKDTQNLQIALGCSGPAKAEYFPLKD